MGSPRVLLINNNHLCPRDAVFFDDKYTTVNELRPHFVFISPPSMEVYEERLRERESETEDSIRQRLHAAEQEMSYAAAEGNFDLVIVNEFLDETYDDLVEHLKKLYPNVKD